MYVIDGEGNLKAKLMSTSFPLGVVDDATFSSVGNIVLDRKDTVLMLTDGILETSSPEHQMFGEARTVRLLQRHRKLPARRILEALQNQLREFSRQADILDDVTAVILKIN